MEIPREFATTIGSVVAALIAGSVAFLVSVFTKEAKTSEFRQAWIDGLRNDVSEFVSAYHYIASDLQVSSETPAVVQARDYIHSIKGEILKIEEMQARIELRLNPVEHKAVIDQLRKLVELDALLSKDFNARKIAVEHFIASVQAILKTEWARVKSGEAIYRATKWISLLVVVVTAITAAIMWLHSLGASVAP